jgi:hypothetical protein
MSTKRHAKRLAPPPASAGAARNCDADARIAALARAWHAADQAYLNDEGSSSKTALDTCDVLSEARAALLAALAEEGVT